MKRAKWLGELCAVVAAGVLAMAASVQAATIWNGPKITFSKFRGQDETSPVFQDRITPRVWLTRGSTRGLYNIRQESAFTRTSSPIDTEWSYGTTADLPNLKFTPWVVHHGGCSPCQEGKDTVVHLISEDIYIDIKILSWPAGTGNVTYERSTPPNSVGTSYALEYYHTDFKHYFTTTSTTEAAALDASKATGWLRTGQVYPVVTESRPGMLPVCRFFSAAFAPKSSHFYTLNPAECADLKNSAWVYEGDAFFAVPPVADMCPSDTTPLHRLYNNGEGGAPNHRFTTCTNIRDRMVKSGWIYEGVGMCIFGESFDCNTDSSFGSPPGPPLGPQATVGNANITITFLPPTSDGGTPITSYTATCTSAGVAHTGTNRQSPITVRGLPNGFAQVCTVVGTNNVGNGPPSSIVVGTPQAINNANYNSLAIPPLLAPTMIDGVPTYDLTLAPSSKQYIGGGPATITYSYNNVGFWGPTLVMNKGDRVRMRVRNALAEDTTTHWHGLLLSGAVDGGPHVIIPAGSTWTTEPFVVKNNASTYWYHPHRHEMTQKQLTLGAGGFIIVRDEEEAALPLPRTYGVDDIPLTLTSRRITTVDGVQNQLQYTDIQYGDTVFSNGTTNAQYTLPKQMVRLRLHNSEIERDYNVGFNDGRTFYVISNDGGLLSALVPVNQLIIAPAERYEVMVDLTNDVVGTSINLEAHNGPDSGLSPGFAGYENVTSGPTGSQLNFRTFTLLHINIGPATANAITALPTKLASNAGLTDLTVDKATQTRTIAITRGGADGPFAFNDLPFDMERIDQQVTLGSTEAWTVGAGDVMSHSFHIHGVQFRIVARAGDAANVNPWEQGWKDTIYLAIKESVTFVARFDETADARYPFMYHCHMINHEDEGLMGQFTVQ